MGYREEIGDAMRKKRKGSGQQRQRGSGNGGLSLNDRIEQQQALEALRQQDLQRSNEVKAVYNPSTGYTDNYTNGIGRADGPGHGHYRTDEEGNLSIIRSDYTPGAPNARRDANELDSRDNGNKAGN